MPTISKRFGSVSEYVDYAATMRHGRGHLISSGRTAFTGTETFADAVKLAFAGWKDGIGDVNAIRGAIKPKGLNPRSYVRRSVVGPGTFNMGAIVQGRPDAYVQLRKSNEIKHGNGKIIRIVENISVSAGVSTDVIQTRGAAILALCDALESQGRRVEIVLGMGLSLRGENREVFVTTKKAGETINLPKLAFAMAHPSMMRRLMFAIVEGDWGIYYLTQGHPSAVNHDDATIYLGHMMHGDSNFSSINAARKWVRDELHKQGIRLADERGQIAG